MFRSRSINFSTEQTIIANTDNIIEIVDSEIERLGNNADLNHIDVRKVRIMRDLFANSKFNGDISKWDVSNVTNMSGMFRESKFDGDISNWNVSKCRKFDGMFNHGKFTGDISSWNISPSIREELEQEIENNKK